MNELPEYFQDFDADLQLAARAAQAAGEVIKNGYRKVHKINAKSIGDLVSQVDVDADKVATEIIRAGSRLPIMSEELSPETDDTQQRMWIVDPLDGTTAYLMGAAPRFSSVLIAITDRGEPVLGLTYFPLVDEWFFAQKGKGAWKNGNRLSMEQREYQLGECWIEMNQYGDCSFETDFFSAARSALRSQDGAQIVTSTFPYAGVAVRIAEQANGLSAAIHDNNPLNVKQGPWDIAANQLIFEEAGGLFLNPELERTSPFVAEPIIISPTMDLANQIQSCVMSNIGRA